MFGFFSKKKREELAKRCQEYLDAGPPRHMDDYVPDSLTEIIIYHGAQKRKLSPELEEIGCIILVESEDIKLIEDQEIREYMLKGVELVEAVLKNT